MNFGEFIEMVMWYNHINKSEFARALGTSSTSIDRLINDAIKLPPMKMQKISAVLDIPLEVLFMWQGHELSIRYTKDKEAEK